MNHIPLKYGSRKTIPFVMPRPTTRHAMVWIPMALIAAALVFGIYLTSTGPSGGRKTTGDTLKVAVVTDALFSDGGWGSASANAAELLKSKYDFEVTTEDNVSIADIEPTLERYAQSGYDLIIAHGFQWGDAAVRVGKNYPDVRIVVFTGLVASENVASIFPMQQEGSYLLGALAGMMTKTGVIAFVGGEEYPNVINILEGFKLGARQVNPDLTVVRVYLNDWDNPAKGKEAANALIRERHADVIFHVADTSGRGVIEAASENGVLALGAVQDQNSLGPDTVLASFVLDVDKAYDTTVQKFLQGTLDGGIVKPGIETFKGAPGDGIVYISSFHSLEDRVPANVKQRVQQLTQDIVEERLIVPERLEESK